jgi:hypothetical protein
MDTKGDGRKGWIYGEGGGCSRGMEMAGKGMEERGGSGREGDGGKGLCYGEGGGCSRGMEMAGKWMEERDVSLPLNVVDILYQPAFDSFIRNALPYMS